MTTTIAARQTFVGCKEAEVTPGYVGEVKQNLRDGYGAYTYPNSFFRYEGEWRQGLKDGFGKLKMRDGGHYEGQFTKGEIDGVGCRYWVQSENYYEGQFEKGEMNGKGLMKFGDGRVYEGGWAENKMDGNGILIYSDGSKYDGSFYRHKRHGEGRFESDTEVYEGSWINDMKHGSGVMAYKDGSIYEGQWRADLMNGEGSLVHFSGTKYDGIFCSGRPLLEPSKILLANPQENDEKISLEQNNVVFTLELQCVTEDGEVTTESGRTLKLTAGLRCPEKEPAADAIEETTPHKRITPFGFEVETYPITLLKTEESTILKGVENTSTTSFSPSPDVPFAHDNNETSKRAEIEFADAQSESEGMPLTDGEETSVSCPTVPLQQTVAGRATFVNVTLPPFVMQERMTISGLGTSPDSSDTRKKNRRATETSTKLGDMRSRMDKQDEREGSSKKRRARPNKQEEKLEELMDENFCRPGDYVVIVEDATENPFLEIRLEPLFIYVTVLPPAKKSKSRSEKK